MQYLEIVGSKLPHLGQAVGHILILVGFSMCLAGLSNSAIIRKLKIALALPTLFMAFQTIEPIAGLLFDLNTLMSGLGATTASIISIVIILFPALVVVAFTLGAFLVISPDAVHKDGQLIIRKGSITDKIIHNYAQVSRKGERSLCNMSWAATFMLIIGVPVGAIFIASMVVVATIGVSIYWVVLVLILGQNPVVGPIKNFYSPEKWDKSFGKYKNIPTSPALYIGLGLTLYGAFNGVNFAIGLVKFIMIAAIVILSIIACFMWAEKQYYKLLDLAMADYRRQNPEADMPTDTDATKQLVIAYQTNHPTTVRRIGESISFGIKLAKNHLCPTIVTLENIHE